MLRDGPHVQAASLIRQRATGSRDRSPQRKKISDCRSNQTRCDNPVGSGSGEGSARHTIYDRACAVLYDRAAPGGSHGTQTFGPVTAHSRQHNADQTGAENFRRTDE